MALIQQFVDMSNVTFLNYINKYNSDYRKYIYLGVKRGSNIRPRPVLFICYLARSNIYLTYPTLNFWICPQI